MLVNSSAANITDYQPSKSASLPYLLWLSKRPFVHKLDIFNPILMVNGVKYKSLSPKTQTMFIEKITLKYDFEGKNESQEENCKGQPKPQLKFC